MKNKLINITIWLSVIVATVAIIHFVIEPNAEEEQQGFMSFLTGFTLAVSAMVFLLIRSKEFKKESSIPKQKMEEEAYNSFASLHPHEAYHMDNVRFCNYMRKQGYNITDEEIAKLIME